MSPRMLEKDLGVRSDVGQEDSWLHSMGLQAWLLVLIV